MNLFKRGFASITRKPGKTAILMVLIFVLCNIIAGAISVKNAINNTRQAMQDKLNIEVSVSLDTDAIRQNNGGATGDITNIESLTPEIIKSIGSSEYVKSYDYYTNLSLTSTTVNLVESDSSSSSQSGSNNNSQNNNTGNDKEGFGDFGFGNNGGFSIKGGENPKVTDIENGDATLYKGNTFTDAQMSSGDNVVLISKDLAEANNLSVGSTITMTRSLYKMTADDNGSGRMRIDRNSTPVKTLSFDFTVVGIFDAPAELTTTSDGTLQETQSSLVNTIYTSNAAVNKINDQITKEEKTINGANVRTTFNQYTPTYVLKNPGDLALFTSIEKSKLPTNYKFTDNSSTYNDATAPMTNLGWIAGIILYVAIGATILILSLLITLFLRDRRHEMGIYLSLGERKFKIASQILIEVLSIAIIAVTLSVFSGNLLAKNISSGMLQNQIVQEQQKASETAQNNRGPNGMSFRGMGGNNQNSQSDILGVTEEMKDTYSVNLDMSVVILIYAVGLGTIIISTLIPIIYTLRLKPKKILM
jgi:ABC-type transport system, involved in lipoprotein release, permease component